MSRHIRVLAGEDSRSWEEGGGELQGVEHRKGVFELVGITVVEGQQRGGAGGQGSPVQPCCELRQGKYTIPPPRQNAPMGAQTLSASNPVISKDGPLSWRQRGNSFRSGPCSSPVRS